MGAHKSRPRQSASVRRVGYVVGILVTAAILYAINLWPGWQSVPFLTDAFEAILPLVNVSLFLSIAFNFIYLFTDPPWLKSLGDLVNAVIGFVVLVWMWNVFPFTFPDDSAWMLVARCLLAVTIAATAISSVVLLVMTARAPFASRATASYREHPQGHH